MKTSARRGVFTSLSLITISVVVACVTTKSNPPADAGPPDSAQLQPEDEDRIPCDVRAVLQAVCQKCHQNPPIRGAPFPLVRHSDIVRIGPDGEIRALMIAQLESRRMPLEPETIEEDSRTLLLAWLHAGAPAAPPQMCTPVQPGVEDAATDAEAGSAVDAGVDANAMKDAQLDAAMTDATDATADAMPELDAAPEGDAAPEDAAAEDAATD